jgi:UDP:flavonoid glycosyltransferase YjiC (YdhE family)
VTGTRPRVLITTAAALGHFHPLAAVAANLREQEVPVMFASSPGFCRQIEAAGFEAVPCGMDWQSRDLAETWPEFRLVPRHERNSWINSVLWARRLPEAMIPDLVRVVEDRAPSVILSGRAELAGPTVGELAGVPYASASAGRVIGLDEFIGETSRGRNDLRRELGLPPDPAGSSLYRNLYLNFIPEMFLPARSAALSTTLDLRPPEFDDPMAGAPAWLLELGPRSVIYVTLGSILGEVRAEAFHALIGAVRGLGYTVVVTVGHNGETSSLAARFPGVHVTTYIPQRHVLERAALVVCHGGINTLLGALSHGVPVLVVPTEQSDQRWNAERCVELGVGLSVGIEAADEPTVRQGAAAVLGSLSSLNAARACMHEFRRLPGVEVAVQALLDLAAGRGTAEPGRRTRT